MSDHTQCTAAAPFPPDRTGSTGSSEDDGPEPRGFEGRAGGGGSPSAAARPHPVPPPANSNQPDEPDRPSSSCGGLTVPPVPGGAGGRPPGSVPPPEWVAAEVRSSAHLLRGLAERLLALADLLPLPPDEVLDALGSTRAFARYPAYELYADVQVAVNENLLAAADSLQEAGERPLQPRPHWSPSRPGRDDD